MKIAMLSPAIAPNGLLDGLIGGAETYAISLAIEMAKQKHSITVITSSKSNIPTYHFNENLEIKYIPVKRFLTSVGEDTFSTKALNVLMADSYDLIHVHQIFTGFNTLAYIAGKLKHIPTFGTDHGGGPIIYRVAPSISARLPNSLISVSDYSLNHLRTLAPHKNAFVAYGGVDTEIFNPDLEIEYLRKNLGLTGYKVVLCVGRLLSCKGYDVAIRAAYHLPIDTKLLIVGPILDLKYYKYLKQLAKPLGDRVIFVGHASARDLPRYYNLCDVFVRSSVNEDCFGHHYNFPELLGLVKLEAMACGKPVVVSNVGGLAELVSNGKTGLIVKPGSHSELAQALISILSNDKLRRNMSAEAFTFINKNYSWRTVSERVLNFYKASI